MNKAITPFIEHPAYTGPIVVSASVLEFGAAPNSQADQTRCFQDALDWTALQGGGVVWAPAGKYRFDGSLKVSSGVTLMGQWYDPNRPGGTGAATVYHVYAGKGLGPDGGSFIEVGASGGIAGAIIFYPEQNECSPVPYPPAVKLADRGRSFATARCLTLINPWEAIHAGPEGNELHTIEHIYGTPMARGILVNKTTDIGRIQHVRFSPYYWLRYADTSVDEQALLDLLSNAVGLELQRTDWEYVYRFECEDYGIGIRFERDPGSMDITDGPNGQLYDIRIDRARIGLQFRHLNTIGMCVTRGRVQAAPVPGSLAVEVAADFDSVAQLFDLSLASSEPAIVSIRQGAGGAVSFQNCSFQSSRTDDAVALEAAGATVLLSGCSFHNKGTSIECREGLIAASIAGCRFPSGSIPIRCEQGAESRVMLDAAPRDFVKIREPEPDLGAQPQPHLSALYPLPESPVRIDWTQLHDKAPVIQAALETAAREGGGIVYLPPGPHLVASPLIVPEGVELRGSYAVPHHTNAPGTTLYIVHGEGDPDSVSSITLMERAGIRGLNIWYPRQRMEAVTPYPWTIRLAGEGAWIIEVSLGNSYKGIDAWSGTGGHYIEFVTGCMLKEGIRVSGSERRGWLKNIHLNPHMYFRTIGTGLPNSTIDQADEAVKFDVLLPWLDRELEYAFRFGKTKDEVVFNCFSYRSNLGLDIAGLPGEGFDGTFYGLGCDGTVSGFRIVHTGDRELQFINAGIDIVHQDYMQIQELGGFPAKIAFMNSVFGGYNLNPRRGVVIDGGHVRIQQVHFRANGAEEESDAGVNLRSGRLSIYASVFGHIGPIDGSRFSKQMRVTDVRIGAGTSQAEIVCNAARDTFMLVSQAADILPVAAGNVSM
ncbi:glycoside hydrolase family 55 protein [Cohnella sp. REN36]|uniref:glycoside hydrolase family 55 protein n=1 Tax=Cohnella sp. REN36 TaxID=2887347 RepID=UPI001D13B9F5|nr:glycoside hydrolase family 55 protein [Cohnella sp. REN36]MCC3372618.1 glycoside hydrolase family 55 protein [Cohnella sp. REN36]